MRASTVRRFGAAAHGAAASAGASTRGRLPYGGFQAPHVSEFYTNMGKYMQAVMWFWVFYRAKEDGPVVLGLRHPWDGHGHGHGHGGAHHDDHDDHSIVPGRYYSPDSVKWVLESANGQPVLVPADSH